ncbi:hypothetical protein MMC28_001450 [Mycoblastus sanguinarius]|nr:hypothetical protein [Mycoblastus sanguinarius]
MATIYSNSTCTIAASSSTDDSGICLVERDPDVVGWFGLEFPYPGCELVTNRIICDQDWPAQITTLSKKVILHPKLPDPKIYLEAGPLSQRGWYLQERRLSPRILHFTEHQLLWECESTWCFESSSQQDQALINVIDNSQSKTKSGLQDVENPEYIYNAWFSIVREFSSGRLTRITDQLPALSGLANGYLRKLRHDVYLAGLWKGDMIRGLFWAKNGDDPQTLQRPSVFLAPSWSWVSMIGPIFYPVLQSRTWSPVVLEANVTAAGLDSLGQVRSGVLRLYGCLKRIRRGRRVLPGFYLPPPRVLIQLPKPYGPVDVKNAETWLSPRYTVVEGDEDYIQNICGQMYFDDSADSVEESIYCLCMAKVARQFQTVIYVLFVIPVDDSVDCYRRIGIGEIIRADWFDRCEKKVFELV